jgi:hypothetical protein
MSRSRTPLVLGGAAAAGIGYYLYTAGGNTKVAQKQAEGMMQSHKHQLVEIREHSDEDQLLADAHKLSAKVKGELPGRGKEAEKDAERVAAKAGAKVDSAVSTCIHSSSYPFIHPYSYLCRSSPHPVSLHASNGLFYCIPGLFSVCDILLRMTFPPKQLSKTQAELERAKHEAEAYAKETKAATLKKVDEFDKKVEAEASKAKSGISSWFGGK